MLVNNYKKYHWLSDYVNYIATALIVFPAILFIYWIYNHSFNMISRDEYRIAGNFIRQFHQATTFQEYLNAFFIQENESRPIVVRLLYLLTYWIEGTIDFKTVCLIGNMEMLTFLYILWLALKKSPLSSIYFVPIPFITLNLAPYFTYLFSYETFFYVSSFFIPVAVFYTATLGKYKASPYLLLFLCLGIGSITSIISLFLIGLRLLERKYREVLLTSGILLLSIFIIPSSGVGKDSGTLLEIIHNWKELALLVFSMIGSFASILSKNSYFIIGVGMLVFSTTSLAILATFSWKNYYHRFLSISFLFFLAMLFLNCLRRWRHDYEGYLTEIINSHKIVFSVSLLPICYLIGVEALKHRKVLSYTNLIGTAIVSVVLYVLANFNNILNIDTFHKTLHTDIVNWELSKSHPHDPYHTYSYIVNNKLFKHGESFDQSFITNIKEKLKDTNRIEEKYPIEIIVERSSSKNTYGFFTNTFTIQCGSYPFPKKYNQTNGIYLFLISKKRTVMLPVRLNNLSIRKLVKSLNPYNDGFFCLSSNLDIPSDTYRVAVCTVQDMTITDFFFTDKRLVL